MSETLTKTRAEIDRRVDSFNGDANLALISLLTEASNCCNRGLFDEGRDKLHLLKVALQCAEISLWQR